jgi:hypothetical protein
MRDGMVWDGGDVGWGMLGRWEESLVSRGFSFMGLSIGFLDLSIYLDGVIL